MEQLTYVGMYVEGGDYVEWKRGKFEIVMIGSWSMFKLTDGNGKIHYINPHKVVSIEPMSEEDAMKVYEHY